ncbi:MAG: nucleotidyltransferase domain-containing protein [Patescibacteria group bacterium]
MGKVFSWYEIIEHKVPELQNFPKVTDRANLLITGCQAIIGAIIYGSILRNDHSRRSDIDGIILFKGKMRLEAMKILQEIDYYTNKLHVPLEFIPIDDRLADTSMHSIELSFYNHLSWAAKNGGVVKFNPLPFISFNKANINEELKNYLRYKNSRLYKAWPSLCQMQQRHYEFMQKILEAPIYIARKMLRWRNVDLNDDSKKVIKNLYPRYFPHIDLITCFKQVNSIDDEYTEILSQQTKNPNEKKYAKTLEKIKSVIPAVFDFILLNMLIIEGKITI